MSRLDATFAALRAAKRTNAGALLFEIARSEMSYCDLPPAEYSAMVIAAAIKEAKLKKVQAAIQGDQVRVSSPSKDELQTAMAMLRSMDFGVELKFGNYR